MKFALELLGLLLAGLVLHRLEKKLVGWLWNREKKKVFDGVESRDTRDIISRAREFAWKEHQLTWFASAMLFLGAGVDQVIVLSLLEINPQGWYAAPYWIILTLSVFSLVASGICRDMIQHHKERQD